MELKPCPFCGSNAIRVEAQLLGSKVYCYAVCCYCKGQTGTHNTGDRAIEAWNMRANDG